MKLPETLECTPLELTIKHEIKMHFSELFWTNIFLAFCALVVACLGVCYRSKCIRISLCWKCIDIQRDIENEIHNDDHIEMPTTEMHIPNDNSDEH